MIEMLSCDYHVDGTVVDFEVLQYSPHPLGLCLRDPGPLAIASGAQALRLALPDLVENESLNRIGAKKSAYYLRSE